MILFTDLQTYNNIYSVSVQDGNYYTISCFSSGRNGLGFSQDTYTYTSNIKSWKL